MEHGLLKALEMSPSESTFSAPEEESQPTGIPSLRPSEPNRVWLLLERGLELFGRGERASAIQCWEQALELAPGHAQALDYLSAAAGHEPAPPSRVPGRIQHDGVDRNLLRANLKQGNYQEAWQVLEAALRLYPDDPELMRARDLLEPRVALRLAQDMRLSMPPRVTPSRPDELQPELNERQTELLRLAESSQTYSEILARSPFGEVETLLGLRSLEDLGLLDDSWPHPPRESARGTVVAPGELDLSNVEGVTRFELLPDLNQLSAAPGDLSLRCVSELTLALRLLGAEETVIDVAALTSREIQIVRRIGENGPFASVAIDRAVSQLGLARLQVEMACKKLEQP
ncbi:MAG: tetratricopeptide repeat protein [Polyangiaceae bacterium]